MDEHLTLTLIPWAHPYFPSHPPIIITWAHPLPHALSPPHIHPLTYSHPSTTVTISHPLTHLLTPILSPPRTHSPPHTHPSPPHTHPLTSSHPPLTSTEDVREGVHQSSVNCFFSKRDSVSTVAAVREPTHHKLEKIYCNVNTSSQEHIITGPPPSRCAAR